MFAYTSPSYPTYSPPTLYPVSHIVPRRAPTARERYLQALADAQSARERYVYELEEQRVLASLRQQEALRQAELRQRDALRHDEFHRRAVQDVIFRRRSARPCVGNFSHPVLRSSAELQASTQHRRAVAFQRQQEQPRTVEELFEALLGGSEGEDDMKLKEQQRFQEARAEHERRAARHNAKVQFMDKLNTIREEAQAARNSRGQTPLPPTSPAVSPHVPPHSTPTDSYDEKHFVPFIVHLTRQPEVRRDRAARTIQRQWRSHSADAAARKDALSTIEVLRSRLQFLKRAFSFPEHLEFKEHAPGRESGVPALLYSPLNTAVHTYTHELTKLLMNADAVPSGGSRRVREARRTFVRRVEEEIEAVDARVREIWHKRVANATPARPGAEGTPDAATEPTPAEQTSNAIHEDKELSSDAVPTEATVDVDTPASPSTAVPSRSHYAEPHGDNTPSEPTQDVLELRPVQYEGGTATTRTEQDPQSPFQTEPTTTEVSHAPTDPKEDDLVTVNDATTNTNDLIAGVGSASIMSQTTPTPASASSEMRHELLLDVSQDRPEDSRTDTLSSSFADPDITEPVATELTAPSDVTHASAPASEPFDVVYPSSPSSISSGLENMTHLGTESDVTVKGDTPTVTSEVHVPEVVARSSNKQDSQDDGFELL